MAIKGIEGLRVVVIEDALEWQSMIQRALKNSGHTVVGRAVSLEKALKLVSELKKLKVDLVTLDGNLSAGHGTGIDGRLILEAIRKVSPNIKIIGMSLDTVPNVDIDIGKPHEQNLQRDLDWAIVRLFGADRKHLG